MDTTNAAKQKLVKWGIFAIVLIIAFLLGFIPMWMKANDCADQNEITQKALTRSEISNLAATAIVDSRRGEYESARQNTSEFFTKLDAQVEKGESGAYPVVQNEKFKSVFTDRDAIITLLAQRDPASVERLTDIYLIYRQSVGETVTKTAPPTTLTQTPQLTLTNSRNTYYWFELDFRVALYKTYLPSFSPESR